MNRPLDIDLDNGGNLAIAGQLEQALGENGFQTAIYVLGPDGDRLAARSTDPAFPVLPARTGS